MVRIVLLLSCLEMCLGLSQARFGLIHFTSVSARMHDDNYVDGSVTD